MNQALIVSLNNGHKPFTDKLKEAMSVDQSLETFTLRDVETKKRYNKYNEFSAKLQNCLKDSNRVFLVLSAELTNGVENGIFPENSRFSNAKACDIFKTFVTYEKELPINESKIVLLDFDSNSEPPTTLSHLLREGNIFKDNDASKISQEAVDVILGKCRIKNHGFPTKKEKEGCTVS